MQQAIKQKSTKELTVRAIGLGLIIGLVFAVGNAYLGLKVGLTVSASIPAAVISMAVLRLLTRGSRILENNMVQTLASAGEAVASGAIFTIPALYLLGAPPTTWKVFAIAIIGGILGIVFNVPLRHHLMVEEHDNLPFPEGTACAAILKSGESSGARALLTLWGLLIGVVDKVCMGVFRLWPETAVWSVGKTRIYLDTTPALLGVGYVIGVRYSLIMVAGGALAWWVLIPLITLFGGADVTIFPSTVPVAQMDAGQIWSHYIRYIGTGAVAVAGILSLLKLLPILSRSIRGHFGPMIRDLFHKPEKKRTETDLPPLYLVGGLVIAILLLFFLPQIKFNSLTVLLTLILGLFVVALTAITVGLIGVSSCPMSGMIICALLATTGIFLLLDWTDRTYLIMAMTLGSIVGIAIGVAADTSQDLKTGYLVGATPMLQQIAMGIGILLPALLIGWVLRLLNHTYGFGSDALPAPQANLMALIVKGVIDKNLPYFLVLVGAILGVVVELLGVGSLPFALGLYLPLSTSLAIGAGGILSFLVRRLSRDPHTHEHGVLIGSGLIAGDALTGVTIALLTVVGLLSPTGSPWGGSWIALISYGVVILLFGLLAARKVAGKSEPQ
ncbi:MAG: OPT family oligopeptide transporter [Parachlamydiales bacterium]